MTSSRRAAYTVLPALATAALLGLSACEPAAAPEAESLTGQCTASACHAGVEQIHYGGATLTCVDCHLGDADAVTKEAAHVTVDVSFNPSTPGSQHLDNPTLADLDEVPLDVIRFLNPSDYRVVRETCGSSILGGGNCHTTVVENSLLLNRATLAGTFAGGGFVAGVQGKTPRFGIVAVEDPYVPEQLPAGAVDRLDPLPDEVPDDVQDEKARAFYPIFEQLCIECHLQQDGPQIPGRYYSSGCNACHMVTHDDGRTRSGDMTQDREEMGHVGEHRFTNLIPDQQCARCHISHLGRSLLAQGVRERSEHEGDAAIGGPNRGIEDPEHHVPWGEENYVKYQGLRWIFGKPYPFFIEDEDGTNGVDETPPDVHTAKGLGCIDCHNIREAHGDKHMATRMDLELDVRCSSCHGRPGTLAPQESDAGLAFAISGTAVNERGDNNSVFKTSSMDDTVQQRGRFTGTYHPVTQITHHADPANPKFNPRTRMGCELHAGTADAIAAVKQQVNDLAASDPDAVAEQFPGLPAGFTFESTDHDDQGRVECFTCHNSWTVNCYGCHIVRDDRETYVSRITGETKKGRISTFGMSVVADALAMGFNGQGRVSPMVGTSNFLTYIDSNGETVFDAEPLTTHEGLSGEGNTHAPVHHHTVQQIPRDCDGCHPSTTDSHDEAQILRALGLGTGEFTFTDGEGRIHWLDRLVAADYDGDGEADDPSFLGVPEQLSDVDRLVGTTHAPLLEPGLVPDPGPLDLETINRVLAAKVVPQRPVVPDEGDAEAPEDGGE